MEIVMAGRVRVCARVEARDKPISYNPVCITCRRMTPLKPEHHDLSIRWRGLSVLYTLNGVIQDAFWGVHFMLGIGPCMLAYRYPSDNTNKQIIMVKHKKPPIPEEIREKANQIVSEFNKRVIKNSECFYVLRYDLNYLYLDRRNYGSTGPIARLKYHTGMNDWEFAIYKYSRNQYDSEEWFFPGSELVDGSIEGALQAGLKAYPLRDNSIKSFQPLGRLLQLFMGGKKI